MSESKDMSAGRSRDKVSNTNPANQRGRTGVLQKKVSGSCSTSGTRRVSYVAKLVASHE